MFLKNYSCYYIMVLKLPYRINQGLSVVETLDNGKKISVEFIVRDIILFPGFVHVNIEVNNLNSEKNSYNLRLNIDGKHEITPRCTLHLPRTPILYDDPDNLKVFLYIYAPDCVEFSERRMYPLPKEQHVFDFA